MRAVEVIEDGCAEDFCRLVGERFELRITVAEAEEIRQKFKKFRDKHGWATREDCPDDSLWMWVKNRFAERGLLEPPFYTPSTAADADTARLHVFFLCLSETDEHIARLWNENKEDSQVARSKIGSTNELIGPIDGTAAMATQWPTDRPPSYASRS